MKDKREPGLREDVTDFVVDICFDYACQDEGCKANLGLSAIRILLKGKKTEQEFKDVWLKWREMMGTPIAQILKVELARKEMTDGKEER